MCCVRIGFNRFSRIAVETSGSGACTIPTPHAAAAPAASCPFTARLPRGVKVERLPFVSNCQSLTRRVEGETKRMQLWPARSSMRLGVPCFFSDGFSCYLSALIEVYHTLKTFPRTGKPGRPKHPVKEPHPDLVYGQVVKKQHQGRLQALVYRVRCGAKRFEELGLSISTSLLERLNLTLRQALAPLVRKSGSFWKDRTHMRRRVVLLQAFYNFARPHMSLRVPLSAPGPRALGLIQPKWRHQTPGMAAGLTDHVWTFRELLTAKFEPVHNQSSSG